MGYDTHELLDHTGKNEGEKGDREFIKIAK